MYRYKVNFENIDTLLVSQIPSYTILLLPCWIMTNHIITITVMCSSIIFNVFNNNVITLLVLINIITLNINTICIIISLSLNTVTVNVSFCCLHLYGFSTYAQWKQPIHYTESTSKEMHSSRLVSLGASFSSKSIS